MPDRGRAHRPRVFLLKKNTGLAFFGLFDRLEAPVQKNGIGDFQNRSRGSIYRIQYELGAAVALSPSAHGPSTLTLQGRRRPDLVEKSSSGPIGRRVLGRRHRRRPAREKSGQNSVHQLQCTALKSRVVACSSSPSSVHAGAAIRCWFRCVQWSQHGNRRHESDSPRARPRASGEELSPAHVHTEGSVEGGA